MRGLDVQHRGDPESLGDGIRGAIKASPLSLREIARRTDLDPAALSRFVNGKAGMSLDSLNRIAAELGLRVVAKPHDAAVP